MHKTFHSKAVKEDEKMEEEYIQGSSICALFVKEEVNLITFLDCKQEFG